VSALRVTTILAGLALWVATTNVACTRAPAAGAASASAIDAGTTTTASAPAIEALRARIQAVADARLALAAVVEGVQKHKDQAAGLDRELTELRKTLSDDDLARALKDSQRALQDDPEQQAMVQQARALDARVKDAMLLEPTPADASPEMRALLQELSQQQQQLAAMNEATRLALRANAMLRAMELALPTLREHSHK
jgi:hypothetical protein